MFQNCRFDPVIPSSVEHSVFDTAIWISKKEKLEYNTFLEIQKVEASSYTPKREEYLLRLNVEMFHRKLSDKNIISFTLTDDINKDFYFYIKILNGETFSGLKDNMMYVNPEYCKNRSVYLKKEEIGDFNLIWLHWMSSLDFRYNSSKGKNLDIIHEIVGDKLFRVLTRI
jgi:hypothetical protein